jgi:hypothetical protein
VAHYRQELDLRAVLAVKQVNTTIPINKAHKKYSYKLQGLLTDRREHGMCGEDSLNSTNCLRLDKPKLFSFFANHSFSTVTLPTSAVKRYFEQVKLNKKIGVKNEPNIPQHLKQN